MILTKFPPPHPLAETDYGRTRQPGLGINIEVMLGSCAPAIPIVMLPWGYRTPRARPRPMARKCLQDIRCAVFHRLFSNHSIFYTVEYEEHLCFIYPYWHKVLIYRCLEQKHTRGGSLGDKFIIDEERASEEICHFQRDCHLISTGGASFHAN